MRAAADITSITMNGGTSLRREAVNNRRAVSSMTFRRRRRPAAASIARLLAPRAVAI
jgi:hypothetical protein